MRPLYHEPHFTFRFAEDRIVRHFHLDGLEAGRRVKVFKIDPGTGERMGLLKVCRITHSTGKCYTVSGVAQYCPKSSC